MATNRPPNVSLTVSQSEWNLPPHFMLWWKECRGAKGRWSSPRYNMYHGLLHCKLHHSRLDKYIKESEMCCLVSPVSTSYCKLPAYTPDNTCVSTTPHHHTSTTRGTSTAPTNFLTRPAFPASRGYYPPLHHRLDTWVLSSPVLWQPDLPLTGLGRLVKLEC